MEFDLTTWSGVAALALALVSLGKKLLPDLISTGARAQLLALALGVLLAVASKASGLGFLELSWLELVLSGLTAGIGSGVAHDKVLGPLLKKSPTA